MSTFASTDIDRIINEAQFQILKAYRKEVKLDVTYFGNVIVISEYLLARYNRLSYEDEFILYSDANFVSKRINKEYSELAYLIINFRNILCHNFGSPSYYELFKKVKAQWADIHNMLVYLGVLPNNESLAIYRKYKEKFLKDTDVKLVDEIERLAYRYHCFNVNVLAKFLIKDFGIVVDNG